METWKLLLKPQEIEDLKVLADSLGIKQIDLIQKLVKKGLKEMVDGQ